MAKKKSRSRQNKEPRATPRKRTTAEPARSVTPQHEEAEVKTSEVVAVPWYEKHEPIILAMIIFVAFLLRLAYLNEIKMDPDYAFPNMDAAYKDYWARSILAGGPITESTQQSDPQIDQMPYLRPPAYPFFLSFIYLLTGTSYTAVRIVQMALGLASIFLLYRLGRKMFGAAVGLGAAAFMAVYWIFIYFEGELNAPSVIVFLLLGMMNMLYHWPDGITRFRLVIPALCYGILVLIRPETLLFSPVFILWAWFALAPKVDVKKRMLTIVAFFAIIALLIAPVTLRNYIVSGEPVLICTIGGLNFYAGHNEGATGSFPDLDYAQLFGVSMTLSHNNFPELLAAYQQKEGNPDLDYSDLQSFFVKEGLRFIAANPLQELGLIIKKTLFYWGPAEISSNKVLALEKKDSPVLRFLPGFAPVAAFFFLGLILLFRNGGAIRERLKTDRNFQMACLLAAFVFVSFATHLLFFVVARFRVPAIPIMILFGAYALYTLVSSWQDETKRPWLLRWSGVALGLLVLFSINFSGYEPEADRWHFQRGAAHGVIGEIDEAIEQLKVANEYDTTIPAIPSELGFAYAFSGDFVAAEQWYRKALEIDPNHGDTLNKLGYALVRLGRYEEAIEILDRSIAANHTEVGSYLNKADALAALAAWEEVETTLARAEEVAPDRADASFRLAQLYVQHGDRDRAIERLREAIGRAPDDARLHNFLGYELASRGDLEEAEDHYLKAIDIDPNFTLAHNNLGNLYTHLKDYDRAVTHYSEVVRVNADDPHVFYGWGIANAERGETERAITNFELAVRNNPNHFHAFNYLGTLLMEQGNIDEAIERFKSAIVLNPQLVDAQVNLGNAYAQQGRHQEALERYEIALRQDPGNTEAQQGATSSRQVLNIQ